MKPGKLPGFLSDRKSWSRTHPNLKKRRPSKSLISTPPVGKRRRSLSKFTTYSLLIPNLLPRSIVTRIPPAADQQLDSWTQSSSWNENLRFTGSPCPQCPQLVGDPCSRRLLPEGPGRSCGGQVLLLQQRRGARRRADALQLRCVLLFESSRASRDRVSIYQYPFSFQCTSYAHHSLDGARVE